jgi:hypothetical protein
LRLASCNLNHLGLLLLLLIKRVVKIRRGVVTLPPPHLFGNYFFTSFLAN